MYGAISKRQIPGPNFECTSFDNCGDHSFVGVSPDSLNFTDAQIEFCNGEKTCLYDLAVTGDEELAGNTRMVAEQVAEDMKIIGKSRQYSIKIVTCTN